MSARIDALLDEIKSSPKFVAAAAVDRKWIDNVEAIERGLDAIERRAEELPAVVDILDEIHVTAARKDLPLKQRLLEIERLMTRARDIGRSVQ